DNRNSSSSTSQLYRTGFTTDINELDVIYGGEKRLFKSVKEIIEKYDPPAVFVYQTCVTALIGDDIEAVSKKTSKEYAGHTIVPVRCEGFRGVSQSLGHHLANDA
ncbi:nitrogenase iron-molybdenum cofactor biosynthesis protein NifE, partial [Salmonella enterica subsp. enterica serovar Typhimurium]|nr:nitrogenase iron-molybdenum cofactor biosynthesis protein NifE [Salmonella enterica subsp. enterica serovar Typhimurium]